jgi:hypothetical protein
MAFYFGLGCLITHELDAVSNHEWRVLPLLRALPDQLGMDIFVAAHVPLCAVIVALIASTSLRLRCRSRLAVSGFLLLHASLHALWMNHVEYEFSSALSTALIFGGGAAGALHLFLESRDGFTSARRL